MCLQKDVFKFKKVQQMQISQIVSKSLLIFVEESGIIEADRLITPIRRKLYG